MGSLSPQGFVAAVQVADKEGRFPQMPKSFREEIANGNDTESDLFLWLIAPLSGAQILL
jgi:hypothetical protein